MGDVQLFQRRALPPGRTGAVKQPDIPDTGGLDVAAGFAGLVTDKIPRTRAADKRSELFVQARNGCRSGRAWLNFTTGYQGT